MNSDINESLRECCALGDLDGAVNILKSNATGVNSQNQVNGWTALHWAAKRNHVQIVKCLVEEFNADTSLRNFKDQRPIDIACNEQIRNYLSRYETDEDKLAVNNSVSNSCQSQATGFTPNYLAHPPFIYANSENRNIVNTEENSPSPVISRNNDDGVCNEELVLKIRNGSSVETDFIEVEFSRTQLTFNDFARVCCEELVINVSDVRKIRKLPNTILRKDKDIRRLTQYQEIEFLLNEK